MFKEGTIVFVISPNTDKPVKAVIKTARMKGYSVKEIISGEEYFLEFDRIGRYEDGDLRFKNQPSGL